MGASVCMSSCALVRASLPIFWYNINIDGYHPPGWCRKIVGPFDGKDSVAAFFLL